MAKPVSESPCLRWDVNCVYRREELLSFWRISSSTLIEWQKLGLPVLKRGTKSFYYLGADVVAFLRTTSTEPEQHRRKGITNPRRASG